MTLFSDKEGPIDSFSWECFIIKGAEHSSSKGAGKDILVFEEQVMVWKDMGGHGLTPHSLDCAVDLKPDVLIIGTGVDGAVRVSDDVRRKAYSMGIKELLVQRTPNACGTFNELTRNGRKAVLLAHGTC